MVASIKPEDIDATLKHGRIFAGKVWRNIIAIMYVAIGVMFALFLFNIIFIPLEKGGYSKDDAVAICGTSGLIGLTLVPTLIIHFFYRSGRKKVKKYIEDAVILNARAVSKGERLDCRNFVVFKAVSIEVSFTYDDKRYVRQSTYKDKPLYLAVFKKYVNKTITIAYSPKYNEIAYRYGLK